MRKIIIALTAGAVLSLAACGSSASSTTASSTSSATSVATAAPGAVPSGGKAFSSPQTLAAALNCKPLATPNVIGATSAVQCDIGSPDGDSALISMFPSDAAEDNYLTLVEGGGSWGNGDGCVLLGPLWAVDLIDSAGSQPCTWAKARVGGTEYAPD
jgi:hypothetical protein